MLNRGEKTEKIVKEDGKFYLITTHKAEIDGAKYAERLKKQKAALLENADKKSEQFEEQLSVLEA